MTIGRLLRLRMTALARRVVGPRSVTSALTGALTLAAVVTTTWAFDAVAASDLAAGEQALAASLGDRTFWLTALAALVFEAIDSGLAYAPQMADGEAAASGDVIGTVSGSAAGILTGERTALNFLQRMSGIATLTGAFVARVPASVRIMDTRKTTPGLRAIEKYAVVCGGGTNHRMGLHDMIMIKDNHREIWQNREPSGLAGAVAACRAQHPELEVEVEVDTLEEFQEAIVAGPDWILLDNMSPEDMRRCVALNGGDCRLEASGGIDLSTIDEVAITGIDAISLGCLTHSSAAADIGLDLELL